MIHTKPVRDESHSSYHGQGAKTGLVVTLSQLLHQTEHITEFGKMNYAKSNSN